jgi:hypothetical protein
VKPVLNVLLLRFGIQWSHGPLFEIHSVQLMENTHTIAGGAHDKRNEVNSSEGHGFNLDVEPDVISVS